ncbi:MAG TPA: malto-oligosyltrehalose synthase, partial [Burkholderiales bacterium]|nr:malto-oligosyltrehalose synthase [Burkholderiales bacterium]
RARIDVITEFPDEWSERLQRWRRLNRRRKRQLQGVAAPSANDEYLFYQTLIGIWPLGETSEAALAPYRERIGRYMLKAAREAKVHTSWTNVNEGYESALQSFVTDVLSRPERNPFVADFAPWARRLARIGMFNSLSQVALKIASPGVPDFYQGNELWDDSLVDPDNRRPVDYTRRSQLLDTLKSRFACPPEYHVGLARQLLEQMEDGAIKLYVTWRGLALRRELRSVFTSGEYVPLEARGQHAERVCAFARLDNGQAAIVAVPRLIGRFVDAFGAPLGEHAWTDTVVVLPGALSGHYCNTYTGERITPDGAGEIPAHRLFDAFPVALLFRVDTPL